MRSNSTMTLDEITRVCTVSYAKSLRACAVSQGRLLETFLETKDLALLLEEDEVAFTDDDANALKAAIDDLKQKVSDVKKLNDSALGGKMSGSVSNIESLMGEVPDVSQIASLATAGEGEKLNRQTKNRRVVACAPRVRFWCVELGSAARGHESVVLCGSVA